MIATTVWSEAVKIPLNTQYTLRYITQQYIDYSDLTALHPTGGARKFEMARTLAPDDRLARGLTAAKLTLFSYQEKNRGV